MHRERGRQEIETVLEHYDIGAVQNAEPLGGGHINATYLVTAQQPGEAARRYTLQRLNGFVFRKPTQVIENIADVTDYLRRRIKEGAADDMREVLTLIATRRGALHQMADGELWRMYGFVEDTVTRDAATPDEFYSAGRAFGEFFRLLADYPADRLHETIPDFHNTPERVRQLRATADRDAHGRAKAARGDIDFVLARAGQASELYAMFQTGQLPLRVTHNDTKLNNVLLDTQTGRGVCVIDLDTVMPGLVAYDFGDAIRYGANTGAEDEPDPEKCGLSLDMYRAYARGFLEQAGGQLTPNEVDTLALGAKTITLECGMRFLADYLDGDVYFKTARPEHNLQRARTQFSLVADMERKWNDMTGIICDLAKGAKR